MVKVGKDERINFMPTYLRWRIALLAKTTYFYIIAFICVIICVYMIVHSVSAYYAYEEQYEIYEALTHNEAYSMTEVEYNGLQAKKQELLQRNPSINTPLITITLIDAAMVNSQDISLKRITFTEDGFSVDGVASTEEAYQEYMNYMRAHLQGWSCNGKQEVERDSQYQLFHLDGHKKKSDKAAPMASQS